MDSLVIFNVHRIVLQCYSGEDEIGDTHSTRGAVKNVRIQICDL
jgi:hypothetical protein